MTKYVNDNGVSEMWTNTKNYISAQLLGKSDVGHTHSASDITSGLATVATSGAYSDLTGTPTIPTVNNATLTIQKNGTNVQTFTANQSTNATANITVPTKTSDLTNDSGFITSDNTKIPLAGTDALAGSIIPSTDNTYDFGSVNYKFKEGYFNKLRARTLVGDSYSGVDINYSVGATLVLRGKNRPSEEGVFYLASDDGSNSIALKGTPSGTLTWGSKNVAMQEDVIPRSGGAVISGNTLGRIDDTSLLSLKGGTDDSNGGQIVLLGASHEWEGGRGAIILDPTSKTNYKQMFLYPNGTWTWSGTACQVTSDQRLKQQINAIDDKLLDAWEDVNLVQFKYNDAVEQKSDNARLHTGYVVQQIDEACKSHNVDISDYGLYCHEEYPQETEEVEVEQADGTKVKERKVVREASEHYSLRYTEALIVECAYLRKCIKELRNEIEELKSSK